MLGLFAADEAKRIDPTFVLGVDAGDDHLVGGRPQCFAYELDATVGVDVWVAKSPYVLNALRISVRPQA